MGLSDQKKTEVTNLQKIIKQCEGIVRTSQNAAIQHRVKIDLKKAKERLEFLCPDGIPDELVYSDKREAKKVNLREVIKEYSMLAHFPLEKISPHCEDDDVNLLSTIIKTWDSQLSPAVSDQHIKLDFSMSSEREYFHREIENLKWQMKGLGDSIEDHFLMIREDAKDQLREMKLRQSRNFINTGSTFLKRLRNFWLKVHENIQQGGSLCMNCDDLITFDKNLEVFALLDKKPIREVVEMLTIYLEEALEVLNPPDIKKA